MQQAVSIAQNLGDLTVNDTRVAGVVRMIPRAGYDELLNRRNTRAANRRPGCSSAGPRACRLERKPHR